MTITNDRQKLIDKVTKLMALAEGTVGGPEAETARKMAIELMAKHNMSYSDMTAQDDFQAVDENTGRKTRASYETILLGAIANFNGCATLLLGKSRYKFVGRPQDIDAFNYMRAIIYQQRDAAWRTYYTQAFGKHPGAKYLNRWKNGFAIGVSRKLNALQNAAANQTREWGLMVIDPAKQALDWFSNLNKVGAPSKGRGLRVDRAGVVAGSSINLNRGVERSGGPRLAIGAGK